MPIDRIKGEQIDNLGMGFLIEPPDKWADTVFFDEAAVRASHAFMAQGAMMPVHFDEGGVSVQRYPQSRHLAFIFCKVIAGKELYFHHVMVLSRDVVADLKTQGRWEKVELN